MNNAMQRYLEAATGLTSMTKASAEKIVKQLVRQGEAATDNAGDLVDELLERQRKNRDAVSAIVKAETGRVVKAMGLASVNEVERLQKQVADLKRSLADAEKTAKSAERKAETASKAASATKKPAAKKPAAKKAAAKKPAAKKAAAKKPAAKKTTKKATKKAAKKSS